MLKIGKSTQSEVFDQYTTVMSKFLHKRGSWATQVLSDLASGVKPLSELLTSSGKGVEEFIVELSKQGKSTEEIAKLTGKSADEVAEVLSQGAEVTKVLPEAAEQAMKGTSEVAIEEASKGVITDGKLIAETVQSAGDLKGKTLEEVVELYQSLKRSRTSLKGTVTQLRNELVKAEKAAEISAEELAKKDELVRAGERLLKSSEDETANLAAKITELGGQLDEAGNVIQGLKQELSEADQQLGEAAEALKLAMNAIQVLEQKGVKLDLANRKLIQEAAKQAEVAGYYKNLYEEAQRAGMAETVAGKVAKETAAAAEKKSIEAANKVSAVNPTAETVVIKVVQDSKNVGVKKAVESVEAAKVAPTPPAKPAAPATPATPPKATPTSAPAPKPTPASPAPVKPPAATPTPTPGKGRLPADLEESSISSITNIVNPASKPAKESFLQKLILKNSPYVLSGGAGVAGVLLKFSALLGLAAGAYMIWKSWAKEEPAVVQNHIKELKSSQYSAIERLNALSFKEGSEGHQATRNLISKIITSFRLSDSLTNPDLDEKELVQIMANLDETDIAIDAYLENQEKIKQDLTSPEGFDEAIAALNGVKEQTSQLKMSFLERLQNSENAPERSTAPETRIGIPETKENGTAPTGTTTPTAPDYIPQKVKILDQEIDIGNEGRGLRSAANRIIAKVINSPEGQAFIDPDNVWGGWLPKTPMQSPTGETIENKAADYLRALKYLYLNKVFDRHDLRKFVRNNLPKVGRKRLSGWNKAIKHYANGLERLANQEKNDIFTQFFSKSANNNEIGVISNKENIEIMKKKADQISKDFYQGAIKDLDDQYAKSYYTGLKSLYDQKLSTTEADFKKLYEVHKETGADLIGSAHPLTITVADAMANGGVVENLIEQHRHNQGVTQSMPSGNFRNRNAWILASLVKLADKVDEEGHKEASDLIDAALVELASL